MGIYHISWAQDGCTGLNAVVAAFSENQALRMLHLSEDDKCQKIRKIGESFCVSQPTIFAYESL